MEWRGGGVVWRGRSSLSPVHWRKDHHDGQRTLPQDIWGRLGKLELFRLGREGSEGMYSLPQLMATQQTEPGPYQGLTAKEQEEMGTS